MIRVLVVDDSSFVRTSLSALLNADAEMEVVATARDGIECLAKIKECDPDVVTLDVDMPRMDGLTALEKIMSEMPVPVIMISSLTETGADSTLKALEIGAMDFIPKSKSQTDEKGFNEEVIHKIKILAKRKAFIKLKYGNMSHKSHERTSTLASDTHAIATHSTLNNKCKGARDLVVIGVSTGGPPVVQKILSALPAKLSACILVSQHMPASFTGPFAKRLDNVCQISVSEAVNGDKIVNGHAYICPGGKHLGIKMHGALPEILVTEEPKDAIYKPTVNLLMETAALLGRRVLGVMLTGMGSDGVEGAKVLKEKGGWLIAQNEASCVVYGMPKAVVDAKLADQILDVNEIAAAIMAAVKG